MAKDNLPRAGYWNALRFVVAVLVVTAIVAAGLLLLR